MTPEAHRLHTALVAAFPAHVTAAFSEHGYPLDRTMAETIEEATAFLDAELGIELELPYREQRRSPLELFRAALGVVARKLQEIGMPAPIAESSTVDGDPYELAPGSSSVLGSEAHEAHLAWGTAKAMSFMEKRSTSPVAPVILLMSSERADRDVIAPVLESPGLVCVTARNPAAVVETIESKSVLVAVVDLAHRSARDAVARLTSAEIVTVVYGDDIDDLAETGLRAQGVRLVIDRTSFVADPARFVPLIV